MTFYAIFQYGSGILGVGTTTNEAISDARERIRQQNIPDETLSLILGRVCMATPGDVLLLQCSEAVYEQIRTTGSAIYDIVDGMVVLAEEV
ncbi:hypothetical protein [Methanogenium organophilum]|uniref:Uncharacterized protein n=1 Tax=Methanogenium organophilum TaxID=2199 RepID=A0A9X9T8R1_METOG|nr:hypothetical protein [Methanogenium organophilum]WAI01422.1 hypothetical protein OU421_00680 [Methanogenium organophilum]